MLSLDVTKTQPHSKLPCHEWHHQCKVRQLKILRWFTLRHSIGAMRSMQSIYAMSSEFCIRTACIHRLEMKSPRIQQAGITLRWTQPRQLWFQIVDCHMHQLQSLLELAIYFRSSVQGLSKLVSTLVALHDTKTSWNFSPVTLALNKMQQRQLQLRISN